MSNRECPGLRVGRAGIAGVLLAAAHSAQAHHSIAAVYDGSRQQRLEGVVSEFQFVNPHPFVIGNVDLVSRYADYTG